MLDCWDSKGDRLAGSVATRGVSCAQGGKEDKTYPVSAIPITSRPPIMTGNEALWMGVGLV